MSSLIEKPKPGMFKAVCRLGYWTPGVGQLQIDVNTPSKWDNKLSCNVFLIQCPSVEFTDRADFERHMRQLHHKKKSSGHHAPWSQDIKRGWRGPKLTEDGLPWVDQKYVTETCAGCGLVVQIDDGTLASERFLSEHLGHCAGRAA